MPGRKERREQARALAKEIMQGERKKRKTFETFLAIILALIPWGFSMLVIWRIILWGSSWLFLLHIVLTSEPAQQRLATRTRWMIAIVTTIILSYLVSCPTIRAYRREQAEVYEGRIVPKGGWRTNYPMFEIGDSARILAFAGPKDNPAINFVYDQIKIVHSDDGEVLLSTRIRDRAGNVVVKITDNNWQISRSNSTAWAWNYNDEALEVMNGSGQVVLQIRALPGRFRLQGEWRDEQGNVFKIFKEAGGNGVIAKLVPPAPRLPEIVPIFLYPSSRYWGRYRDNPQPILCTQHFLLLPCGMN